MARILVLPWMLLSPLVALAVPDPEPAKDKEKKVDLVTVKMKDLVETHIATHKGKVVVVYVWAFWHAPSKWHFEDLVRLHHKYADKGLELMTVDLALRPEMRKKSLGFLQAHKASFANYHLEGGLEEAQKQWKFEGMPAVVVYGRDGRVAKLYSIETAPISITEVEDFVKEKLKK